MPSPSTDRAAPMAAAPVVWRPDGRPDWRAMWTSFCDLALHGGPPHRGIEQALRGPLAHGADAASDPAMLAEIRRGIWETTGLFAEPRSPGWVAVTCESPAMATWLAAAIELENVEARAEDDRVLLPAGPRFQLANEVKSVITVVAKTHHYAAMHAGIAATPDPPAAATAPHGFRCIACGLEAHVSRPATAVELDATCPIDGARMARVDIAARPRRSLPRPVTVAVQGPEAVKAALIEGLRRRYGRRRAVVVSSAQAMEGSDHAVDLVLVDVGEDGVTGPAVDATIAMPHASAVAPEAPAPDRQAGGRDAGHVLVVAPSTGIDVVMSWLERELGVTAWRERATHG